jgi:CysZ protein
LLKEIIIAIQAYFDAHQFISRQKLWKWIVVPGIVYALLFCIGMYFFWHSTNNVVSWITGGIGRRLAQAAAQQPAYVFVVMAELMIRIVLMLFYFSLFKYLILIIGAPAFAYLSERTESSLEGRPFTVFI